jgi:hypothetical protein
MNQSLRNEVKSIMLENNITNYLWSKDFKIISYFKNRSSTITYMLKSHPMIFFCKTKLNLCLKVFG